MIISQEDWEVIADQLMQEFGLERLTAHSPYADLLAKEVAKNTSYQSILYVGPIRGNEIIYIFVAKCKIGETEHLSHSFVRVIFSGNFSDTLRNLYAHISAAMICHKK